MASKPEPSLAPQDSPGEMAALTAGVSTGIQFIAHGSVAEGIATILTGAIPTVVKLLVKATSG